MTPVYPYDLCDHMGSSIQYIYYYLSTAINSFDGRIWYRCGILFKISALYEEGVRRKWVGIETSSASIESAKKSWPDTE